MEPTIRRKRLILISLGVLIVIAVLLFFQYGRRSEVSDRPTEKTQTELSGVVVIDNTDKLSQILLPEQYDAVYNTLSEYIRSSIGKSVEHAYIKSDPQVAGDGTVNFEVVVENPSKTFAVAIDRSQYDKITVKVPSTNFIKTIKVFGAGQED